MTHTVTIAAAPLRSSGRAMRWALAGVALAALAACQPKDPPTPTAAAPTTAPAAAPAPVAYTPPSADALYQMVAPIALYPDKLVALVLAGAIHPDEVSSAYNWLAQNPTVAADAVNQQPWDPSIKALTTFPNALNLLQSNLPWTTALGQAYNNDPADVLNAVQVMRQRAQQAGHLQSNAQQRVVSAAVHSDYTPNAAATAVYSGPAVVPPPAEYIAIEPAQAQTVYVPSYDPGAVYGAPVAYYEGYRYHPPVVSSVSPVAIGALAFGAGVVITAALDHHDWGWNAWGVHWGDAPRQAQWRPGDAPLPPAARPAVTYRQTTYVSHVNNVVNNYRSVDSHNTTIYNAAAPTSAAPTGPAAVPPQTNGMPATTPTHHGQAMLAGAAAGTALGAMALHHGAGTATTPAAVVPPPAAALSAPAAPHARPGERIPAAPSLPRSTSPAAVAPPPAMAAATPAPQAGHRAGLNMPMAQTAVQPHAMAHVAPATGTGLQVPHGPHGTNIPAPAAPPVSAPQPVPPHSAPVQPPHPAPIAAVAHTPPPPPAPSRPAPMAAPRPAPVAVAPHVQAPPPPPPRPVRASPPPPAPQQHAAPPHEAPSRHKDEHGR